MPKENEQLQQLQQQVQSLSAALTEQIFLRDVLLLINTTTNPYDRSIVEKLMSGTKLDDGDWAHIFGEAGKLKDLITAPGFHPGPYGLGRNQNATGSELAI